MPHDIPLNKVETLDDLLGGEWNHEHDVAEWTPYCREADAAVRKAISKTLGMQAGRCENLADAFAEVIEKLGKYLCDCYAKESHAPVPITNLKFLGSPNRAGWLSLFAKNWTLNWLRERIRVANGDERVQKKFETGVTPVENFTAQQERLASENNSLQFDVWQFARGRGHAPQMDNDDYDPRGGFGSRDIEQQALSDSDAERLAHIRLEVNSSFSPADAEFLWDYVKGRYESGGRADAARKRYQRLCQRIRQAVTGCHNRRETPHI